MANGTTTRGPTVPGRPLTQGNLATIEDATAGLISAFQQAEAELRDELSRVVRIVALDPDSTKRYRRDQIRALYASIATWRAHLEGRTALFAEGPFVRIYVEGMRRAQVALELAGQPGFSVIHRQAIEVLAADLFDDVAGATGYLDTHAKRTIREATKVRLQVSAATGATVPDDARALARTLQSRGVRAFVDAAGREWNLGHYAEMVVRTKSAHGYNTATVLKAEEEGTDVYEIRDGERSGHEECLAYSGDTCDAAWALANPIEHPNCVRAFSPLPLATRRVQHSAGGTARAQVQDEWRRRGGDVGDVGSAAGDALEETLAPAAART